MPMKIFFASAIVSLLSASAVYMLVVNGQHKRRDDIKSRVVPFVLISCICAVISDLVSGSACNVTLLMDVMPSLAFMMMISSSLWECRKVNGLFGVTIAAETVLAIYYLLCSFGLVPVITADAFYVWTAIFGIMPVVFHLGTFFCKVRSIKAVMKSGSVWAFLSLGVDSFYLLVYSCLLSAGISSWAMTDGCRQAAIMTTTVFLTFMEVALAYRLVSDSLFIFWSKQERSIVESMKITNVEAASDASKIDAVYKDVFERVEAYFENEKPYLNSELTINDLVKVLYSNKLYISRAISQFTGRNFCQFVNYHRIMYSTECFKANHDLKIHEMASMSGFNSIVSFNMAFRLFMGENPSDWCRKERGRFIKRQK